jgi:ABC-2 type transport system ATP-binding protein
MMIDAVKIIAGGSPKEIKTNYLKSIILEIECDRVDEAITILDKIDWIRNAAYFGKFLHATIPAGEDENGLPDDKIVRIREILEKENGMNVMRIDKIIPSLEDVFVNLLEGADK